MKTAKDWIELPEKEKEVIMLKVIKQANEDQLKTYNDSKER